MARLALAHLHPIAFLPCNDHGWSDLSGQWGHAESSTQRGRSVVPVVIVVPIFSDGLSLGLSDEEAMLVCSQPRGTSGDSRPLGESHSGHESQRRVVLSQLIALTPVKQAVKGPSAVIT